MVCCVILDIQYITYTKKMLFLACSIARLIRDYTACLLHNLPLYFTVMGLANQIVRLIFALNSTQDLRQ